MNSTLSVDRIFNRLLSHKFKERSEKTILSIAIFSYLLHLLLILCVNYDIIESDSKFFKNPIAAIYTPFSFILIYEVYLLVFFIPKSISFYIGKQYEIITLIVIRRLFKDLSTLEFSPDWFHIKSDLQFTYDVLTSLVLFILIYLYFKNINTRIDSAENRVDDNAGMKRFVQLKKIIASILVPVLLLLAAYTFTDWLLAAISDYQTGIDALTNLNNIFFEDFFNILIMTDVLLLLVSLYYSDSFHKIIRNSGFVISTILIKVSFSVEGIVNNTLIVGAVLFGFLMLIIHNLFEKKDALNA